MKFNMPLSTSLSSLLTLLFLTATSHAEQVNVLTDAEKAEGWTLLFDGKSLDGWNSWRTRVALEVGKGWVVENGSLKITAKGAGDIYTSGAYENFELSLEYKTMGNSGIFIRVNPEIKGAIFHAAPEVQVENTGGNKSTSAGGLYALYDIEGEKVVHPKEWNTVKIRLQNNKGTHWFNGKKVYEYTIGDDDWNKRVAASKFKKYSDFGKLAKGHIGLQDHGAKVEFRNIKLRELKSN